MPTFGSPSITRSPDGGLFPSSLTSILSSGISVKVIVGLPIRSLRSRLASGPGTCWGPELGAA